MRKRQISAQCIYVMACIAVLILAGGMGVIVSAAQASTTGAVGSPKVSKGKTDVEARVGYSTDENGSGDDERLRSRVHIDHGFTEYYAARLVVAQDKRRGDSYEHDAVTFENRFYVAKAADLGFDFGVRASYTLKDGDKKPDAVTVGLYELVPFSWGEVRANQIFKHEVGEDSTSGLNAELRFQAVADVAADHRLGVESFHNFGNLRYLSGYSDQQHTIGPVLKGSLAKDVKYETGYRVGVSKGAPDHNLKFIVNYSF
jgi:hypothetical protein